jgi:hypothetical protein
MQRFGRFAVVAMLLAATMAFTNAPPARAVATHNAHVWNLAAGSNTYNGGKTQREATAAYIIEVENPLIVIFTEICHSSWQDIANKMDEFIEASAASGFVELEASEDGCDGGPRGNGYFAKGTSAGPIFTHRLVPDGTSSTDEPRWAVCKKISSVATIWTACAAHFSNSPSRAEYQADEAWEWWADVQTTPWIFGGDFNHKYLTDGAPPPPSTNLGDTNTTSATARFSYLFKEIHIRSGDGPEDLPQTINTGEARKIDYIFAADSHFDVGPLVTYCNNYPSIPGGSDHRYCRGRFNR